MIDAYIQQRMQQYHIPGLAVAVVQSGVPLFVRGFGYANVELAVPATEHTVYAIASVTKTFTAAAIMLLIEDGVIRLDTQLGEWLPAIPAAWSALTVHHLLSHTAGLKNYTDVAEYWTTTRLDISQEAILRLVADQPLAFAPGSQWAYSNTGYYLLGLLIEQVSDTSYADFLTARIFEPLQMHATRVNDPYAIIPQRVAGYIWQTDGLHNVEYYSPSGTYAAGALLSSLTDLAKWSAGLIDQQLLPQSRWQQMWTPAGPLTTAEQAHGFRMGLGWFIFDQYGQRVVRHNGSIKGFASEIAYFEGAQVGISLCCNLENGASTFDMINDIAEFYIPAWAQARKFGA